jgi:SET and MYND domain-containing protein
MIFKATCLHVDFFLPHCRLLECTEDALKSLTRAADILGITHGTKSQFMKELFGKLEEARAEVSFKLSTSRGRDEQFL